MDNDNQPLLLPAPHTEPEKISKKLLAFNAFLVLAVVSMFFLIFGELHKPQEAKAEGIALPNTEMFSTLAIRAKAAYVFDVSQNRVLYEKNENAQLPLASITKLMTALTALELFPRDSKIAIKPEFLQEEGDSGLLVGESWRLKDLLDFSLIVSSNDGARSVASVIGAMDIKDENYDLGRKDFISKMNQEAEKLGLTSTYFINESGLDEGNVSGAYGSAKDVAKLMQYILIHKPEILEATKYPSLAVSSSARTHVAKNTNLVIDEIPNLLGSKTGYTDLAGGNLVIAFDASVGHPVVVVVLGSTEEGRFEDVSNLVKTTVKYFAQ